MQKIITCLILLSGLIFQIGLMADDDTKAFLREGRVFYTGANEDGNITSVDVSWYKVEGNRNIKGIDCKVIKRGNAVKYPDPYNVGDKLDIIEYYAFEKNGHVYSVDDRGVFTDCAPFNVLLNSNIGDGYIESIDSIEVKGIRRLRITVHIAKTDDVYGDRDYRAHFVEGIGWDITDHTFRSMDQYTFVTGASPRRDRQKCNNGLAGQYIIRVIDNGEPVFFKQDFTAEAVSEAHPEVCMPEMMKSIVDGREWHYSVSRWGKGYRYSAFTIKVMGDTILEGLSCKKIAKFCQQPNELYRDTCYVVYENDYGQVFKVDGKHLFCVLRFDYLLNQHVTDFMDFPDNFDPILKEIDNITINGITRKRYYFNGKYQVEGIGTDFYEDGYVDDDKSYIITRITLESVYENGECIFTKEDFMAPPSAIESVTAETVRHADDTIYDLMGRRVDKPQPGTIYIRNGQKFILR